MTRKTTGNPRPAGQHFVPCLHLRNFVGDHPKNMIWTFDNQSEKWRSSVVEETAKQTNFYSIRTDSGGYDDRLENLLSKIEYDATSPYNALLSGRIPEDRARRDFALFLATLYLRTPSMINAAAATHAQMMDI